MTGVAELFWIPLFIRHRAGNHPPTAVLRLSVSGKNGSMPYPFAGAKLTDTDSTSDSAAGAPPPTGARSPLLLLLLLFAVPTVPESARPTTKECGPTRESSNPALKLTRTVYSS